MLRLAPAFAVILAAVCTAEAGAQFVVNQGPANPFSHVNEMEPEKEELPPPPPTYEGSPVVVRPSCGSEALEAAGLRCSAEQPCSLFLELTAAAATPQRVIVAGNFHTASETVSSALLVSENEGLSWTDSGKPFPGAMIEALRFFDAENGWAAGLEAQPGGARIPFLLTTDDAGVSWRRWDIQSDDDDRSAVMLDVRFDSPEHGYAVIERPGAEADAFELRETFNGGRAWSIRELSPDRPKIPGSLRREEAPTWRIEPDSETGAYVLERLIDGTTWSEAARFQADLGSCAE